MKNKILAVSVCLLLVFCFTACNKKEQTNKPNNYKYVESSDVESSEKEDDNNLKKPFSVDNSWHDNFSVTYNYYNSNQSSNDVTIIEKKTAGAFFVEYVDTKSILYYKANGNDTDYYVIVDGEEQQAHSVLKNKKFSTLSSMFMKLSSVEQKITDQNNVLYMGDEVVGGRSSQKYIQRAYENGNLTQTVYIWVDVQYGFASKCEAYDADDNLLIKWEIEDFKSGDVNDEDVYIDLSKYNFIDKVG